jgi:hypothetical protein
VGKVEGGTTGCRNIRSLQPSKQHALYKMAYSREEYMSTVKTFYQTNNFVTVQRQFWRCHKQWYLQHLQNEVILVAGHVDITFFPQGLYMPTYSECHHRCLG